MADKLTQQQLFEALLRHKYVIFKDGNLIITQDFYKDFGDPKRFEVNNQIKHAALTSIEAPQVGVMAPVELIEIEKIEETPLSKFIIDAKIPEKIKTKTGVYYVNKFNARAEKILVKALKEKVNYQILTASTTLYYRSGAMVKTIANYFLEGIWKDEYNKLVDKIKEGDAQSYINSALKEGTVNEEGSSSYRRRR